MIDEVATGGGPEANAGPQETVESDAGVASSVPVEDDPVKTAPDMGHAQAVADAHGPSPEVREDPVYPVQQFMRIATVDDANLVRVSGRVLIAQPGQCRARLA